MNLVLRKFLNIYHLEQGARIIAHARRIMDIADDIHNIVSISEMLENDKIFLDGVTPQEYASLKSNVIACQESESLGEYIQ